MSVAEQITALKVEGYEDNRAITAQIEAIDKEQVDIKARFDALAKQRQEVERDFLQRDAARTAKIEALESVEAGNG